MLDKVDFDFSVMTQTQFSMNTILTQQSTDKLKEMQEVGEIHREETDSGIDLSPDGKKMKGDSVKGDEPIKEELSSEAKHVDVSLEESELWKKFKTLTNEMIVTKNGR